MTKEALKLALEALNDLAAWHDGEVGGHMDEPYAAEVARRTITAIKAALAQPEQEPVGFVDSKLNPIQRTWVGLTLDDIPDDDTNNLDFYRGGRWAERILKEKNYD